MNPTRRGWPVVMLVVLLVTSTFLPGCALTKDCKDPGVRYDSYNGVYQTEAECERSKTNWLITVLVIFGGGGAILYFATRTRRD